MTSSSSDRSGSVYNLSNLFSWAQSEGNSSQRSHRSQSSMNSGHTNRLVHPERARLDSNHPNYYYNRHAIEDGNGLVVEPSSTGNEPVVHAGPVDTGPTSTAAQFRGESPSFFLEGLSVKSNSLASTAVEEINVGDLSVREPPNLTLWQIYCKIITLPIPSKFLRWFSIATPIQELAWREKMGLNSIIFIISLLVGFCTFGLNNIMCTQSIARMHYNAVPRGTMVVHGSLLNISSFTHIPIYSHTDGLHGLAIKNALRITDGSLLFQNVNNYCLGQLQPKKGLTVPLNEEGLAPWYFPCRALTLNGHLIKHPVQTRGPINNPYNHTAHIEYGIDDPAYGCHLSTEARQNFYSMRKFGDIFYTWEDLERFEKLKMRRLRVYHGHVVDLDRLELLRSNWYLSDSLEYLLNEPAEPQVDMSIRGSISTATRRASMCAVELAKVGVIDTETLGCITSHVITSSAIALIVTIMTCKFLCAVYYELFKTWQIDACANVSMSALAGKNTDALVPSSTLGSPIVNTSFLDTNFCNRQEHSAISQPALLTSESVLPNTEASYLKYIICLVTVYSEGEKGLRRCLDSIALSDYPSSHLLIVVICDGYVVGAGNDRPTPEIVESMMETLSGDQGPFSYYSLGLAEKRRNMAHLSYGFYRHGIENENQTSKRVPMLCITKCGNPVERVWESTRPGNRGKRDSQLILLRLLQRVMFNERMTDLENEICIALMKLMKIKPDTFEAIVMVDADTKVSSSSIRHFVSCLNKDPSIMGLCGETKIGNQNDSWVTKIQVFEYFISHHSTKSFESVFGGVTCLPGCFCMYRIKAPKGSQGFCVPLLANPDIVERYSLNNSDSVHANNLLLLGEDRYLTTLMLKTFPQRKQVFVSQAKCETLVPASFRVLLDQRRRWINSTIHNLLELLLVRDLCGVFCISMQFVVFVELIGTVTLPATTLFVVALLVISAVNLTVPVVPLALLSLILGSSTLLIIFTGHRYTYLVWMLIYMLSLPIWNVVLPLNAFWRFDDFTWGTTRQLEDAKKDAQTRGHLDTSKIELRSLQEYLAQRKY
uniref:chitin synthase n=1 Tax=Blastobotrys adeninivorans TaxID=409370 RepID=A0A060TBL5_BLAAD